MLAPPSQQPSYYRSTLTHTMVCILLAVLAFTVTWVKRRRTACTPLLSASKEISLHRAQCACQRVAGCVGVARRHDIGAAITRDSLLKFELCNSTTHAKNSTVYMLSGHKRV